MDSNKHAAEKKSTCCAASIDNFLKIVNQIWNAYQQTGPGSLSEEWMIELRRSHKEVERYIQQESARFDHEKLNEICRVLFLLCERCITRTEGLCFVSGEAGLVPRQDLHEQFVGSLEDLKKFSSDA